MKTTDKNPWAPLRAPLSASRGVIRNYRESYIKQDKNLTYFRFRERNSAGVSVGLKHLKLRSMTKKNVYGLGYYYVMIVIFMIQTEPGSRFDTKRRGVCFFLRGFENNRLVEAI